MRCFIVVPETGAGDISKIIDAAHIEEHEIPEGYKSVGLEDPPGRPIRELHWDGEAIADGVYISDEDKAKAEAAQAKKEAQDLLNSRFAVFDYDLTTSLIARMSPDPALQAAVASLDATSTGDEIREVMAAMLQKITLTDQELAMMKGYREKYEDWIAKKEAAEA